MTSNKMRLCVLGFGAVGQGLAKVVLMKHEELIEKYGIDLEITAISDRSGAAINPNGLDLQQALDTKEKTGKIKDYPEYGVSGVDGVEVLDKAEYDCLVEATPTNIDDGQPTQTHILKAMNDKKDVVTSNKGPLALNFKTLIETARENNVKFRFEASVGGTMPVINLARESLAGNNIHSVQGILNGTTNYMLTRMKEEGISFEEALKEAQEKGYAELHPEADVEGYDACRKIAILSSLAFGQQVDFEDIYTEGITSITAEDIRYATAMNKSIKLLGNSWRVDGKIYAMVCPMLLDNAHPLSGVNDVFNAIFVRGNMVDETMFYGKGAGKLPTASAVAADVVDCVKHTGKNIKILWNPEKLTLSDLGDFERQYFVRMPADAEAKAITAAFGAVEMVSVEGINEKAFITGVMKESAFNEAAEKAGHIINRIRLD